MGRGGRGTAPPSRDEDGGTDKVTGNFLLSFDVASYVFLTITCVHEYDHTTCIAMCSFLTHVERTYNSAV